MGDDRNGHRSRLRPWPRHLRLALRGRAITLVDVIVLLVAGAVIVVTLFAHYVEYARATSGRIRCASNLRQITFAAIMYAYEPSRSAGAFPRTTYDPATADKPVSYTGVRGSRAFAPQGPPADGPAANDVTAALYLLLRTTDVKPDAFTCDKDGSVPLDRTDTYWNFPGRKHLSYGFNNPYPSRAAVEDGWRFDTSLSPNYPFAADMGFGDHRDGGPTRITYKSDWREMRAGNSANHFFEGQQVAYVDGHVEWQTTPFCGTPIPGKPYRDNIFTNASNVIHGAPQTAEDGVLLPTSKDGPADSTPVADRYLDMPQPPSDYEAIGQRTTTILVMVGIAMAGYCFARAAIQKRGHRFD